MNNKFFYFLICSFFIGCINSNDEQTIKWDSLTIDKINEEIAERNGMFRKKDKQFLKVYVLTDSASSFVQIKDFSVFPEDVIETINLLYDEHGRILAFKDIPQSESGDYFNSITYYFYNSGNTMAYKAKSSFFGENCDIEKIQNSKVTEIRTLYFDTNFKTIGNIYSLKDDINNDIDSSKCIMNYQID